jgi:hypothetical protein
VSRDLLRFAISQALLVAGIAAQTTASSAQSPPASAGLASFHDRIIVDGQFRSEERGDYREFHLPGGFRLSVPGLDLQIRGQNALLLCDRDEVLQASELGGDSGLPRRGQPLPAPRRRLSNEQIRERLSTTLRAIGTGAAAEPAALTGQAIDLLRYLYCEGGIVVVRSGVEVIRCERLWISPVDDRVVVDEAELRYLTAGQGPNEALVVRAPRLTKQGRRWVGRDVLITPCTAAEPHAAFAVDEAEILERDGEFEVIARGQTLQVGGTSILPLPNVRFFTGQQSQFPIKRVRAGYSNQLGAQAQIVLGLPWNGVGGSIHEWLLGRPANEFRGEWELGVGWIQERGFPLEGALDYRAQGLYRGSTEAYFLDDSGQNLREIANRIDGSPIDNESRGLIRSQNRLLLGKTTHLDLVAYQMTDAAVWSEFYGNPYRTEEVPETSTYLHHADGNRLLTVGTRFNLNDFSYRDDRGLAQRFVEELPVVTYQWLAQPIGETPWSTPIVVDLETELGQRRSNYDDRAGFREGDRTARLDQLAEVSAPFHIGPLNLRPYVSGRGTFYDTTIDGGSEGRFAAEAGLQAGTRLSRNWLVDANGEGLRHVLAPKVTYRDRFQVDDTAGEFFVFDAVDQLTERSLVRLELRNQIQRVEPASAGRAPTDFVFVDFAQDLFPDAARDNQGRELGLFYYDFLLRAPAHWSPFETTSLALYGDHDWRSGLRTFDGELQFGPFAGLLWGLEYRTDTAIDGAAGVNVSTRLFERWNLVAGSQRDLDRDEWLAYLFSLRRDDHDWSIELSAVYNPFADETQFRIDFLPRFGVGSASSRDRLGNGSLLSPFRAPH